MSDEQEDIGGVRRFGRRDRKRSLDPRGPLFPPEDSIEEAPSVAGQPEAVAGENIPLEPAAPMPAKAQPVKTNAAAKPVLAKTAPSSGKNILANLLTIIFIFGTISLIGVVAIIAQNPYSALNPFPPFTPLPIVITATFLPPTETPVGTEAPTATFTPLAVDSGNTAPSSASDAGTFSFVLASDQPVYAPNANDKGCNWSSIAGTVTDGQGTALDGYRVHIVGNGVDETVFSGATLTFGAGGFELFLNGTPQTQTYSVQLSDPQSQPLSQVYNIETKASCDQNVAVLQFVQRP